MKTVAFCTLGCKVNQYETEAMQELFHKRGYRVVPFDEISDIYIINTCTVTNMGDRKSRQMIRRAQHKNPNALIAAVGCYAQVAPDDVAAIPGVDFVLGTGERGRIVELLEQAMEKGPKVEVSNALKRRDYEPLAISGFEEKTRAFMKIEDGCSEFCSYCIIPYARGPVRSRSIDEIVSEAKALASRGFTELVLTGIHLSSYGKDLKDATLLTAIDAVSDVAGVRRVRLGSLEPRILTEDFIRKLSKNPKLCPHFHVSLQSGCDETLQRMRRKYTTAEYAHSVKLLRSYFQAPAIATDIMVGFPGETDAEFAASLQFMEKIGFADAHVFAYSNRKGTRADTMPGQVNPAVKEARSHKMGALVDRCRTRYIESFAGKTLETLFEHPAGDGMFEGTAANYVKVRIKASSDLSGQYRNVRILGCENGAAVGELE